MDEILRIKNLSKRYDDISVLENIDLSVKKGEVVVNIRWRSPVDRFLLP